jgi:endonuclease/exonuclease/phosphatase family metal-dependent hydrolase
MKLLRVIAKYFAWILNLVAVALLLCCLAIPHLSAQNFWPIGILGLLTPFVALANILFIALWMIAGKWRRMLLSTVAIILCWKVFSVACAGNIIDGNNMRYGTNALKVISYNVKLLNLYGTGEAGNITTRGSVADFINKQGADIVCLQEFFDGNVLPDTDNLNFFKERCEFPYVSFNVNIRSKRGSFGDIIFSKHPIITERQIGFDGSDGDHNFQYADIAKRGDTFRVHNLHLQSIKLTDKEIEFVDDKSSAQLKKKKALGQGLGILRKLRSGFELRSSQAAQVARQLQKSPYANIVCGDFNDLPTSYAYFTIRQNLRDAFLEKGFGLGRTYKTLSSVLRIDYVLYDGNRLKTLGIQRPKLSYSDHFPLVANFEVLRK